MELVDRIIVELEEHRRVRAGCAGAHVLLDAGPHYVRCTACGGLLHRADLGVYNEGVLLGMRQAAALLESGQCAAQLREAIRQREVQPSQCYRGASV